MVWQTIAATSSLISVNLAYCNPKTGLTRELSQRTLASEACRAIGGVARNSIANRAALFALVFFFFFNGVSHNYLRPTAFRTSASAGGGFSELSARDSRGTSSCNIFQEKERHFQGRLSKDTSPAKISCWISILSKNLLLGLFFIRKRRKRDINICCLHLGTSI